jgi:ribosome maturation factor RimP
MLLEESDLFTERYLIEVSSPGIRRPLRKPDHFAACVGQIVDTRVGSADRNRRLRGVLVAADRTAIRIQPEQAGPADSITAEQEIALPYTEVLEANLDPEFDAQALIQADRRKRKQQRRQERQERRQLRLNKQARRQKS